MSQLVGPGAAMCGTSGPILGSGSLCLCDTYKRVCLIDCSTPHILDPRCIMKAQGYPFFFHPHAPFFTCPSPPFAAACPEQHGRKLASVPSAYWTPMAVGAAACVHPITSGGSH